MTETFDCRVAFADTLIELAQADERIVVVCNDSVGSSNLSGFQAQFPERVVNVGIAEQNMVGVAAGLANTGREAVRHEPGLLVRGAGPDASLHRGHCLDASDRRARCRRPR